MSRIIHRLARRAILIVACDATATLLAKPAIAHGRFPDRPIRMIVPWPPGGATDIQMRTLCDGASRRLGQPIIVENRAGATGSLGAVALKEARPDGYLLSQMPPSGVFRLPHMLARPPFDPNADFTWVMQVAGYTFGVVVRADAPWRTFADLMDYAKAHPDQINYGSPGVGSPLHATMERISRARGIAWTHVPFRGTTDDLQALLAGQVQASAQGSTWAPLVEAGQLRLLVTFGAARIGRFPEVPTLREVGLDLVVPAPYGIAGPRSLSQEVLHILHDALRVSLYDSAHLAILERYHMPLLYLGPEDYAAAARRQFEEERETVKMLGLRTE